MDEVEFTIKFFQNRLDLFTPYEGPKTEHTFKSLVKEIESPLVMKLIESLKKGEVGEFTVNAGYLNGTQDEDESLKDEVMPKLFQEWDPS